jgi:hypothetical protein
VNARQHVEAAADAMLDEHPGLAEYHLARAELVGGGRSLAELVSQVPDLGDVGLMPAIAELGVMSA